MRTRRSLLQASAALAASTLAGCSLTDDEWPDYDEDALAAIPDDDLPEISETLPAGVGRAHVEMARDRARELLDAVPAPVPSDEMPEESVRQTVQRLRNRARNDLHDAENAAVSVDGLGVCRRARAAAAKAKAAYVAGSGDLSKADVVERSDPLADRLDRLASVDRYEGDTDIETLVTAATAERRVLLARRNLQQAEEANEDTAVETVGQAAADIEAAAANADDAEHVHEQFVDAQSSPEEFGPAFERARENLLERLAERCGERDWRAARNTPGSLVDASVDGTPAEALLRDVGGRVETACRTRGRTAGQPAAQGLQRLHRLHHYLVATAVVQQRIEDGDFRIPADADAVAARRQRAVESLRSAVGGAEYPRLTERRLSPIPRRIEQADADLESGYVAGAVSEYDYVYLLAETVAAANERLVDALA